MEEEIRVERACAGVGEVSRLVGRHSHEDLHEAEKSREYALVGILFNLAGGLAYGHSAAFEFDMDDRHAVDEQA